MRFSGCRVSLQSPLVTVIVMLRRLATASAPARRTGCSIPADQARAWKARFAPTVLFLGPNGQELAERLVGVAVPDFYGEYLEARLTEARSKLK